MASMGVFGAMHKRGRGDVDADAPVAVRQFFERERVVDLGGAGVVDAEGGDGRQRQLGMLVHRHLGEAGAAREVLEQELVQMVVMRGRQRAAALQQMRRGQMRGGAGRFQRLDLDGVAVRLVQQHRQFVGEFGGQLESAELLGVARLQFGLQALLLGAGQRGLERVGRRGLVAALALLVEVHRRRVQADQRPCCFDGIRRMAEIFLRQRTEVELVLRRGFPQEIHVDAGRHLFRLRHEFGQAGLGETQHHVGRLDLAALAVGVLDLQGGGVIGKDIANLETAVFFVKYVHWEMLKKFPRIIPRRPR